MATSTPIGRPPEFDRGQALRRATDAFWELGYDRTSTAVLEGRMGIGRSSLYAAFGSKDELYVEAMKQYVDDLRVRVIEPLRAEGPALDVLRAFFRGVARRGDADGEPLRCCLIVRACLSEQDRSPAITACIEEAVADLDDAFHDLLQRARREKTLRARGSLRGLARFLTTTFQALNIAASAGRSRRELLDIIRPALAVVV